MWELIIALSLGVLCLFEIAMCVNAHSYVKYFYVQKRKHLLITLLVLYYFVFVVFGAAIGTFWFWYWILFCIGIPSAIIKKHYIRKRKWKNLIIVTRIDSFICSIIIAYIFLRHFHPELF